MHSMIGIYALIESPNHLGPHQEQAYSDFYQMQLVQGLLCTYIITPHVALDTVSTLMVLYPSTAISKFIISSLGTIH